MAESGEQSVYAAGQAREFLANELSGKENRWIYEYAGLIEDAEVLDWLNYRCSIYADHDKDFLETRMARTVIKSAATHTTSEAFLEGNASQLQGIVGLVDHASDSASEAIEEIGRRLAQEGTVCLVVGPPGAGKTATTLDAAREWGVRTGGHIFGNTSWDGFDEQVHTDVELLEAMASVPGPTLGVVDESNQNLSGEGADNKKAQQFVDRATFIRKKEEPHGPNAKKGSLLIVGHTLMKTAADIRRLATLIVQKPSRADPGRLKLHESEGGKDAREEIREFKGLTDTRETYVEHEASHFDVVLEEDDDGEEVDPDDVKRQEAIASAIRAAKPWSDDHGVSYDDAGEIVGYSETWVGNRVGEWSEGQHRDLVEDPTDGSA